LLVAGPIVENPVKLPTRIVDAFITPFTSKSTCGVYVLIPTRLDGISIVIVLLINIEDG
jgi:hypothetical protein